MSGHVNEDMVLYFMDKPVGFLSYVVATNFNTTKTLDFKFNLFLFQKKNKLEVSQSSL